MNIITRIRKIEDQILNKRTEMKMVVVVEEINGKYYIDNCGKSEEIVLAKNDIDTNLVILKSHSLEPSKL